MLTPTRQDAHPAASSPHLLHASFLSILPRIELHAYVYFRGVKCADRREDYVQETRALAWKYFVREIERGKDPLAYVSQIALFAARHARSGRRVCGQEKGKDVLSPRAQQRHSFTVERLPSSTATPHQDLYGAVQGQRKQDVLEERLRDNTQTPVPEQVAFRLDWPAWLTTITERDRRLVEDLALNHRTQDLAQKYGLSPARISQKRREFHDDWERFCGDNSGQ
jgi:hypothetical protein